MVAATKSVVYVVAATALAAAGAGLWYGGMWHAHRQMKMDMQSTSSETKGMPGMEMPGMKGGAEEAGSAEVKGYAEIKISHDLQQRLGVTFGEVEQARLEMSVRAVGIVRPDETKVARVNLKIDGWVEKLFVNYTGQDVKKGDPLLEIYSPDFLSTQAEYLIARQPTKSALGEKTPLIDAVRRRLELWDVPRDEIDELERTKVVRKSLTLRSPLTGAVLEKHAFEGQHVGPKDELYVVADLSTVWVQAKVYEYELPHVVLGMPAHVSIPGLPDDDYKGKVVFIQPTLDEATRTAAVRIELPNPDGRLKPGMFAHIRLTHDMGQALLVPTAAIIRTGELDIAFRLDEQDRFAPVVVRISPIKFKEGFQVLDGLKRGDKVVTSANFLIDSESRLRAGAGGMAGMPGMGGMEMGGMPEMDGKGTSISQSNDKHDTHHSK